MSFFTTIEQDAKSLFTSLESVKSWATPDKLTLAEGIVSAALSASTGGSSSVLTFLLSAANDLLAHVNSPQVPVSATSTTAS